MSLKLTIDSSAKELYIPEDETEEQERTPQWEYEGKFDKETKINLYNSSNTICYMTLVSLTFNKQMYRPCEIHARMEIYTYDASGKKVTTDTISLADLNTAFKDKIVALKDGSNSIASDYYVYRVNPHYIGTALYVDFIIYSPDKKLTTEISSRTFVARRLFADIATKEAKGKVDLDRSPQNALKNGTGTDDYIQPYLVQYNESFYDLLVRTANRWGEFVYFEGGKLHLGGQGSSRTLSDTYTTYEYADEELVAKTGKDQVSQDDYLGVIKKDTFIKQSGDNIACDPIYSHKVMQNFLNMEDNVYDWVADIAIKDSITAKQNKKYLDGQKDKYNTTYFKYPFYSDHSDSDKSKWTPYDGDDLTRIKLQYKFKDNDSADVDKAEEYCQFSNYLTDATKGLCSTVYQKVLGYEKEAAQNMICVDYGTTYKHIQLGDIILSDYIVTQVECSEDISHEVGTETGQFVVKEKRQLHFRYYAVKKTTGGFYPPMLPSGHIRTSGPQVAKIADKFDPLMKVRYRIKYDWDKEIDKETGKEITHEASPWIPVTHEMLSTSSGSVWMMPEESLVLLNFTEGNIERPYIVGAFQTPDTPVPRPTQFNTMNLETPAGQAIRLTDGYGVGASNFAASFLPVVSLIKKFSPEADGWSNKFGVYNKCFEGGVELTDYFGIYSIKASTDERNISIKSPYGDVNLNAFTGITISAPNGDVKIRGKNVSIEAGNNVSITSGLNVKQGILGHGVLFGRNASARALGVDITKAFFKSVLDYADFSIIRHAIEVVLRPVAGDLKITSNRAMTIQAGLKKADFDNESSWHEMAESDWWQNTLLGGKFCQDTFGMRSNAAWTGDENGKMEVISWDHEGADKNTLFAAARNTDAVDVLGVAVAGIFAPVGLLCGLVTTIEDKYQSRAVRRTSSGQPLL